MAKLGKRLIVGTSIWLLICILLALVEPTHVFIHRRDFDRAAAAFHQNPTPENEAALRAEQEKNRSIRNEFRILEAVGLFAGGIVCYGVYAGIRVLIGAHKKAEITHN